MPAIALKPVPDSRGATPYLTIRNASDAIAWYQRVFSAELLFELQAPDGTLMHAEMQVGPACFMLSEERPEYGATGPLTLGGSPTTVIVYVPDSAATVAKAVAAGATVQMPVQDQFWGDRAGSIVDPFGHKWMVATHIEEPTPEEIERRMKAMFAQQRAG